MTADSAAVVGQTTVPWGCWSLDARLELPFPERFSVHMNHMRDGAACSLASLTAAVRTPLDAKPLRELAATARTAVIAVDDITRPTPAAILLPLILAELEAIPSENIRILVALERIAR